MPHKAVRRRFENSLDMVAARPELFVDLVSSPPSGTENARSMVDSPVLGQTVVAKPLTELSNRRAECLQFPRRMGSFPSVAPLNIKKSRRRGLISGVKLALPKTPITPATPGITPQTSFTFTAEWDSTQRGFLFTPLASSLPSASLSPRAHISPVPDDIDEEINDLEPEYPRTHTPLRTPSRSSSSSSIDSQADSLFINAHARSASTTSTCPSSMIDMEESETKPCEVPSEPEANLKPDPEVIKPSLSRRKTRRLTAVRRYGEFNKQVLHEMDDDIYHDPWGSFNELCWQSVKELDTLPFAHSHRFSAKPLPGVSSNPSSTNPISPIAENPVSPSRFSADDRTLSSVSRGFAPLKCHFGRAFSKLHNRRTASNGL